MAMKRTKIESGAMLAHLTRVLMNREGKSWTTTLLSVARDGQATPMPHMMAYSYITQFLEDQLETVWAPCSVTGATEREERYCRAVLMLRLADISALGLIFNFEDKTPKIIYRALEAKVDSFWVRRGDEVYNLVSREVISFEELKVRAVGGMYLYNGDFATSSAGELKKAVIMLPGSYYGQDKRRKLDWTSIYNRMSCGAWGVFIKMNRSENFKGIAQFAMRMAQSKAPCKAFDNVPVNVYSVIPGTFQRETLTNADGEKFDHQDGLGFVRSGYLADVFNHAPGMERYEVLAEACEGQLLQARPWSVCKQTFLGINEETMDYLVKSFGFEEVVLYRDTMTDEDEKEWETFCFSKGTEGKFAGKMVTICRNSSCDATKKDILNDFNGQKTVFEAKKYESGLRVLAMSHLDKASGCLSTQVLQSFLAADWENGKAMALAAALKMAAKAWNKLDNEEGEAPSWADFQTQQLSESVDDATGETVVEVNNINYSDLANKVAPGFAKKYWRPAFKCAVNKKLEGLSTRFGRCNFETRVIHTMLIPDLSAVINGHRVLSQNESNDVTDCFGNRSGNMSVQEFCDRVDATEADALGKKLTKRLAKKLHAGITSVPAYEEAAKAGEGWDFDGDSWYENLDLGYANRYPKTHSRGYFRISNDCKLPTPLCVDKDRK